MLTLNRNDQRPFIYTQYFNVNTKETTHMKSVYFLDYLLLSVVVTVCSDFNSV